MKPLMAHSPNRCMSFIEWTCIACLPTLLCIGKIIFQWSPKLYPFDIDNDATKDVGKISYQTCINTINEEEVCKSFLMVLDIYVTLTESSVSIFPSGLLFIDFPICLLTAARETPHSFANAD